jgi:hydrogenase-4 component E
MNMGQFVDLIVILALALNFVALAVSRVRTLIHAVAVQGVILGLLPILMHGPGIHETLLSIGTVLIKGVVIPNLLFHALREVNIQREIKPLVNFIASLVLGAIGTGLAIMFSGALPLADEHAGLLLVPASLATVLTGFLVLTTRQKAIVLVLGYLILENGIFMFGLLLLKAMPVLVEAGVLLDLFTAVFVMGIIIHQINRAFDSLSTEHLTELKE